MKKKKNRLRGQTVVERMEVVCPGDHLRLATATAKEASRNTGKTCWREESKCSLWS